MNARMYHRCIVPGIVLAFFGQAAIGQTIIVNPRPIRPVPPIHPPIPRPIPPPRPRPRPPLQRDVPLQVKRHTVEVLIVDAVAVTKIDQVFVNTHDRIVEGTYVFPLDDDVALSDFSMYVNGERIDGKLLSVEEARRQYESIVARMRDPALLEYIGRRMFRARIFPINPHAEVRVKLSYSQVLQGDNGLVRYRYPLGTDKSLTTPIETVSILARIRSKTGIKSVFSPSHKLAIHRESDHRVTASFERSDYLPDENFELYYSLSKKDFGMTILTYRESGKDGFFLLRIAPQVSTLTEDVLPKDIAFVVDTSGSMAGEKIDQAKRALEFCLSNLGREDRFNIIPFSHEAVTFRDSLVPAGSENVRAARKFVQHLSAGGGTNINDALLAALAAAPEGDAGRPYLIVFLTDGLPTIGVTAEHEILKNVGRMNSARVRLHVFGVGYDVNTKLLDLLAEQNRGSRDYVEPGQDLELRLSSFYRKVAKPVLADLDLSFDDLAVHDMFPPRLTDLFAGGELVVAGRYTGTGNKAVELTGTRRGKRERFVDETHFPGEAKEHAFLPRVWATRKVGYLLDHIRLHGESKELKESIVQLATEYGIVTPYTAYLVTEKNEALSLSGRRRTPMAQALSAESGGFPAPGGGPFHRTFGKRSKQGSLRASRRAAAIKTADVADVVGGLGIPVAKGKGDRAERKHPIVRRVDTRTFYRIGKKWVDGGYDDNDTTIKIEAFSRRYFDLVHEHAELAKCFALGERVIVVIRGTAYETVAAKDGASN